MKSCILPFALDVEIKAYHSKAFPLGIAKANINNYDLWLSNKAIMFMYSPNDKAKLFDIYDCDLWSEHDGFVITQKVSVNDLTNNQDKLIDINKNMLNNGCYVSGIYNEFYLPAKRAYKQLDYDHDYLIFGYDDHKGVFLSAGYIDNGFYDYFEVSYSDYCKSVFGSERSAKSVLFHKVNKEYEPVLDIYSIKQTLQNYINPQMIYSCNHESVMGIEAWHCFAQYVKNHPQTKLDIRYARLFSEHRNVMAKRFQTLLTYEYLKDCQLCRHYYYDVYQKTKSIFGLFLKYNFTKNERIIPRLVSLITEINSAEKELIEAVISEV